MIYCLTELKRYDEAVNSILDYLIDANETNTFLEYGRVCLSIAKILMSTNDISIYLKKIEEMTDQRKISFGQWFREMAEDAVTQALEVSE